MFESRRRAPAGPPSPDRWLLIGAVALILVGLALRLVAPRDELARAGDRFVPRQDTAVAREPARADTAPTTTGAARDSAPGAAPSTAVPDSSPDSARVPVPAKPAPASRAPDSTRRQLPAPKPAPPPRAAEAPAAPQSGTWGVQLGAFGQHANAERLRDRVRALGFAAEVAPIDDGRGLERVRVGGLADSTAARAAADSLSRAVGMRAVVVPPGPTGGKP